MLCASEGVAQVSPLCWQTSLQGGGALVIRMEGRQGACIWPLCMRCAPGSRRAWCGLVMGMHGEGGHWGCEHAWGGVLETWRACIMATWVHGVQGEIAAGVHEGHAW